MKIQKFISSFLPEHKINILTVMLLKIIVTIIPFVFPFILKIIIDEGILKNNFFILLIMALFFFVTVVIRQTLLIFTYRLETKVSTGVVYSLRKKITETLLSLSLSFFEKSEIGDLLTVINSDTEKVESFAINTLYQIFINSISLIFASFFLFIISWKLSIICVIPILIFPLIRTIHLKSIKNLSHLERSSTSQITEIFQQCFSNIYLVLSFNLKPFILNLVNIHSEDLAKWKIKKDTYHGLIGLYIETIIQISTTIFVYCIGGYFVIKNHIELGSLIAFGYYLSMLVNPIGFLYRIRPTLASVNSSFDSITKILEQKPEITESPDAKDIELKNYDIIFQNVNFSYQAVNPLFKKLNYTFQSGKLIAVCGDSGSGKSTLIKLLLRFNNLKEGDIFIGNQNLKLLSLKSLRSYFSVVPQDAFFFNKSIWENFVIIKPDLTIRELDRYIEMVGLKVKIDSLENSYNTIMGDRGSLFSGGEKQRLSIARALIRNSPVIILDEATSQLDINNEKTIIELLKKINKLTGKTIIMVAHRLSTICEFDEIIVIENYSITESGSHNELLTKKGKYYQLWEQINSKNSHIKKSL